MPKSKALSTRDGQRVHLLSEGDSINLERIMRQNRKISDDRFFSPSLSGLHDPFLMPDMEAAVTRLLEAREKGERVVIFGDYDVDGVSSTALLFRFFSEIGIECSYRLPHRVRDGYGLKSYVFDELAEKHVKLVITVDCGTRDIEPIRHAKSLGIDVIVTDHHAVPDIIPEEVIAIVNPKRKDSNYPFPNLAGAGVAFKLLHAVAIRITNDEGRMTNILTRSIDLASLGTVADCMPLVGENRVITALGLRQMKQSESSALRKYIENLDRDIEGDADVIGFQLGPRINAAGRMDSPLKALHWLLASDDKVDDWLTEVESLNTKRQEAVKKYSEDALMTVDPTDPILFYTHPDLEHGLIGLIAGKLTEAYGKPSIVLCPHGGDDRGQMTDDRSEFPKREYEKTEITSHESRVTSHDLIASCRSPEWCNLVELLDDCKDYFVRYGGHRQAAGFTIEGSRFDEFRDAIIEKFREKYDIKNLPKKTIEIECILRTDQVSLDSLKVIDRFRPFGIGNRKPIFLMNNLTVSEARTIGKEGNHLSLTFHELPGIKCLLWNYASVFTPNPKISESSDIPVYQHTSIPAPGDILSPIFTLERNLWNGKESVQMMMVNVLSESEE